MTAAAPSLSVRLAARRVRANPDYRLHPAADLPEPSRRLLEESLGAGVLAGALVGAPGSGLPTKVVDARAAQMFTSLVGQSRPAGQVGGLDLLELVLDGVLEAEWDGAYASGPTAYHRLGGRAPTTGTDACGRASVDALRRSERLGLDDALLLSVRLYCAGRLPLTAAWATRFGDPAAVRRYVVSASTRRLNSAWRGPGRDPEGSWLVWHQRDPAVRRPDTWGEKVYVGVAPEALPEAVAHAAELGAEHGVVSFKVAGTAAGLRRPDKLVLYCTDTEQRARVAAGLGDALAGAPAQPVPFTAAACDDGLVSWGSDPPERVGPPDQDQPQSWRTWLCLRLAESLVLALARPADGLPAHAYALARLAVDRVDPATFAPAGDLWATDGAA